MTDTAEHDADLVEAAPAGRYEYRTATLAGVNYPKRQIDVIAVPWDEDADVVDRDGRAYTESFARGAFNGIQRRLTGRNRVTVNRDHDRQRIVGKVLKVHTGHADGLVAELRMAPGLPLADETLALAADGVLDASISFAPMSDGETWSDNGRRRRITRAYLDHIAMVPEPAYDGARTLAVRSAPEPAVSATPWLDAIRLQRMAARYGFELNAD